MQRLSVDFRVLSPTLNYSLMCRVARRLLGKEVIRYPQYISNFNIKFEYIPIDLTALEFFSIKMLSPSLLAEMMSHNVIKNLEVAQFDLVHAHWVYPHGAVANYIGRLYNIPSVVTAHGSDIHTHPKINNKWLRETVSVLEGASKVIFVSSYLRERAKELGYVKNDSIVIPNGIDSGIFKPMVKTNVKETLNIRNLCVGFVGNLIPIKRAESLPKIFKEINASCPKTTFLIIGEGYLRKKIEYESKKLGLDVRFTGRIPQEQVCYYMNAMDVLILPSREEGWPCVVLEAQACGVPVVGTNIGGISEAIADGGALVNEGSHFEQRFANVVVDTIRKNINYEKLTSRGKEFEWSIIAKKELNVYRELLCQDDN